jgi:ferredoxin
MERIMRIVVNRSLCDGNGLCARQAPALILLDENDTPQVLQDSLKETDLRQAQLAVQACPKAALAIRD